MVSFEIWPHRHKWHSERLLLSCRDDDVCVFGVLNYENMLPVWYNTWYRFFVIWKNVLFLYNSLNWDHIQNWLFVQFSLFYFIFPNLNLTVGKLPCNQHACRKMRSCRERVNLGHKHSSVLCVLVCKYSPQDHMNSVMLIIH